MLHVVAPTPTKLWCPGKLHMVIAITAQIKRVPCVFVVFVNVADILADAHFKVTIAHR